MEQENVIWSSCNVNCGSRCPLRLIKKGGEIVRIEPDNTADEASGIPEVRACLRGRALREWVHSKERLLYPLKRSGKRGEGGFERISWDQALNTIASELQRILMQYGNEAVFRIYGTGNLGAVISSREQIDRLMNMLGGQLNAHNTYSNAQIKHAMQCTYGVENAGNNLSDLIHSKLVVFFGNNPAETRMSGGGSIFDLVQAKQSSGVRTIVIDPRYTDTVSSFADEWIPIRPGTDAALASGLSHVLITEKLVDEHFLNTHCLGYDPATMSGDIPPGNSYKEYILGLGPDRTPKSPQWAAMITGIPEQRIRQLAREIGTAKPSFISQGWGPQRHANGEQSARAIFMLAILTGNVGIPGGNTGDREGPYGIPFPNLPVNKNPVSTSIPCFLWTKAIEDPLQMNAHTHGVMGKDRLQVPIKFIWSFASNTLINQHSDINHTKRILADDNACEMIVVIDNVMTSSARFADIILPATSCFEEKDLCYQGYGMELGELILRQQALEPRGESRTLFDICAGVARRLNIEDMFTEGRSHDQWVEYMYQQCRTIKPELPEDFQDALNIGLFKWKRPGKPAVAFQDFRRNPLQYPLKTPSGKIEIFSRSLWEKAQTWDLPEDDVITALPEYHPSWGDPVAALTKEYPLQCIGHHYKQRTHSSFGNNTWLQEAAPQMVWINPLDAGARGIEHGDTVRIFNQFGETQVKAKVTPRIMPGVLSLPQGAWHQANQNGADTNGCINVLTSQRPSPLAKGNPQHTNLVQAEKVTGRKGSVRQACIFP